MDREISRSALNCLKMETESLQEAQAKGVQQSAINFSQGASKASATLDTINNFVPDQISRGNIGRALGIKPEDMPKRPEDREAIANFQQALINRVSQVFDGSQELKDARQKFSTAVTAFEGNHNSVVISAGNWGQAQKVLEGSARRRLDVPADFDRRVLENSAVTVVGATRWWNNNGALSEHRAGYSSRSARADIYAAGSVQAGRDLTVELGTSYAAPEVAGTMAQLHKDYPRLSSQQVENLMVQRLTHRLPSANGNLNVLDYGKTSDYLANGTF